MPPRTALATFDNMATRAATVEDRHDANSTTLRRATAFIDANPDLDIGVSDMARAAYVTPRALHLAFRRHLDTTPLAYLRRVRLDRAHAELQAAAGTGTTVLDIAARWGFSSPWRFAIHYRKAYGHSPSQTLRA